MTRFQYLAIDAAGRERSGGIDAASETEARATLLRRNFTPVRVVASASKPVSADVRQSRTVKLNHKSCLLFTRQLATLIDASVPVDDALGMIASQGETASERIIVGALRSDVLEGLRLGDAMARHPRSFSPLYRAAVAGGERSGQLGFVLNRLSDYLARVHAMRSKVTTAMVYPAALSLVALTVVVSLMIFVVPTLTEQFESFDARLPLLTQILIGTSRFLTTFWPLLLLLLIVASYVFRILWRREAVRVAVDAGLLRAPLIGKWVAAVDASRFVRAVSTLVVSGLPVLESVRAAKESVGNRVISRAVADMATHIEEGDSFSGAMRRSGVFPPLAGYMAASGEGAGELPKMLDKTADHLDREFESFTTSALSLLEPAIIVVMGGVVAAIVLAIMLPVLQLNQLATGG